MSITNDEESYLPAIPKQVQVYNYYLQGKNEEILLVNVSEGYNSLDSVTKVLMQESFVRTITQIKGVTGVSFLVEGKPLTDKNGNVIGELTDASFLRDTGSALHSYSKTRLTLYYPSEKGDSIVPVEKNVRYKSNVSLEQTILDELKKPPNRKGLLRALPKNVKVVNVYLKDGICYINLDGKFLKEVYKAKPEVIIYAITNSIIDAGSASEVQFFVDGEKNVKFQETLSLKEPFDRNLDLLMEGGEKD